MHLHDDTIAAIATAPGEAGLAVVRVSGAEALAIADRVFRGGLALAGAAGNTLHHGWAMWPPPASRPMRANGVVGSTPRPDEADHGTASASRLDEVVAAVFRSPRSYTREDLVELSCHGGRISAGRVLAALLRAGARLARPGEFTLRAFLNGRVDLAQAEAVADLIHAETEAAHSLALSQLAGELSRRLEGITERLTEALAEVEARVDFAEDVGGIEVPEHVLRAIDAVDAELSDMLAGAAYARALREGVRLPLVGRPNVGKSSLFNALLGEERAIVTATPGTTRDRVSETIEVGGIPVTLSDTAGLREASEPIEAIGVARAHQVLSDTPFALWVLDGTVPLGEEDRGIARRLEGKRVLVAINKRDLATVVEAGEVESLLNDTDPVAVMASAVRAAHTETRTREVTRAAPAPHTETRAREATRCRAVSVSAAGGEGLEELREALLELLGADRRGVFGAAVANPRHAEALGRGREALDRAAAAGRAGSPGEIVALELREGLGAIGEVTGKSVGEDLLERIFSRFCIGK